MTRPRYTEIFSNPGTVRLDQIPVLPYNEFQSFLDRLIGEEGTHCVTYFALPLGNTYRFICCMAADENHALVLFSHEQPRNPLPSLPSLTSRYFQFHIFEREIHEKTGIFFEGHPWLKPVRYSYDRTDRSKVMDNYPFFSIEGEVLHEVGVGPIHAGVIEPGYFRFICKGEEVIHLEIQLGYQHRGVEQLFTQYQSILQQTVLSESIAGDTAVGHALAYTGLAESLSAARFRPDPVSGNEPGLTSDSSDQTGRTNPAAKNSLSPVGLPDPAVFKRLKVERSVALELERIAVHIGDTAALCTDIAYQFGQVTCEALRTIVINTTQLWGGNRFGKGLIRPGGTNYPLTRDLIGVILENLREVEDRYLQITGRIFTLSSALSRFEGTGTVTPKQATLIGAVGMAARSSGMYRDIRWSHPFAAYTDHPYEPVMLQKGDVWSRAMLRKSEVEKSIGIIRTLLEEPVLSEEIKEPCRPDYGITFAPSTLSISLVEGWRGEICHVGITDDSGRLCHYQVKDPSLHNWMALALAVRNQEISDFPLCNKSFNLSYCGNDL